MLPATPHDEDESFGYECGQADLVGGVAVEMLPVNAAVPNNDLLSESLAGCSTRITGRLPLTMDLHQVQSE